MMICTICGEPAWSRRIFMCGSVRIYIVRCDRCGQIEKIRVQGKIQRVTRVLKGKGALE